MKYLERILHLNVRADETEKKYPLPNYILNRYSIREVWIDRQKVFLLYLKTEPDSINMIKKHIQKVQSMEKIPAAIVLPKITARQRQNMIDAGIPFIVEDRQCYLPFMGVVLSERCDVGMDPIEKLLPSAQMLLFYYIQKGQKEVYASETAKALGVSAMTITRAIRQLEETGLISTYKQGVMKIIISECAGRELFEKAKQYLSSPIKRRLYIPKTEVDSSLLVAGESALSIYSMLNPPRVSCYATGAAEKWKKHATDELVDDLNQVELQIWKYDPRVLGRDTAVDVLSLAMSFADDPDERIEESVEGMLDAYWRSGNGKGI